MKGPRHHHKKKSHEADRSAVAPAAPTWTLAAPHPMRSIGELHRAIGNHAVGRLLQRKLVVNAPGDVHEQEADRVADAVMRATPASPPPALNHTAPMPRGVQRACSCGGTCEDCRQAEALQRKEGSIGIAGAGTAAPPIVHDVLRSPGQPLDATTRAYMEPRFGRSFADVHIHADARAAESARSVNARAYTVGRAIAFGSGAYNPHSKDGRQLLAHELSHVVQQSEGRVPIRIQRQANEEELKPGSGAWLASQKISMVKSDSSTHWRSEDERRRTICEYISYARSHPELKAQYEEAVAAYPEIAGLAHGKAKPEIPPAVSNYAAALAKPVQPAQAKPSTPTKYPPAPDAVKGITIYFNAVLPQPDWSDTSIVINRPPYRIIPNLRRNSDGSSSLLYWNAFRSEPGLIGPTGWNEWAIGPDSLEQFTANVGTYAGAAALSYMFGPPAANSVEGSRFVEHVFAEEPGEAARAWGRSLIESMKDPGWWVSMLAPFASAETSAARVIEPPPAAAAVVKPPTQLRMLRGGGGGAVRGGSVVGRVGPSAFDANAARSLAPEFEKPAQGPVGVPNPTPTPASPPAQATPLPAAAGSPTPLTPGKVYIPPGVAVSVTTQLLEEARRKKETAAATTPQVVAPPTTAPAAQPAAQAKQEKEKRPPGAYPLFWPTVLPDPSSIMTTFVRRRAPDRDSDLADTLLAAKWMRARKEDLRGQSLVPHHVVPLFLNGPDTPSNVILWNAVVHTKGHQCLRFQPQMATPPVPLAPKGVDLFDPSHTEGTLYFLAGFKNC